MTTTTTTTAPARDYTLDPFSPETALDQLAIDFACNGTPMRLGRNERIVAVIRMNGRQTTAEIARRICTYPDEVGLILNSCGAIKCPMCNRLVFDRAGVYTQHVDSTGLCWCPMSGRGVGDEAALAMCRRELAVLSNGKRNAVTGIQNRRPRQRRKRAA